MKNKIEYFYLDFDFCFFVWVFDVSFFTGRERKLIFHKFVRSNLASFGISLDMGFVFENDFVK